MSSSITVKPKRRLKSDAAGVFVPMTRERLARVDTHREQLGLTRGGCVADVFDAAGTDGLEAHLAARLACVAVAESLQPLVDAVHAVADAWHQRARQRQSIGVHSNQLARYANALAGRPALDRDVAELRDALQSMAHELERQADAELEDQELVAALRDLITELTVR